MGRSAAAAFQRSPHADIPLYKDCLLLFLGEILACRAASVFVHIPLMLCCENYPIVYCVHPLWDFNR